jgi:hypothetical protein
MITPIRNSLCRSRYARFEANRISEQGHGEQEGQQNRELMQLMSATIGLCVAYASMTMIASDPTSLARELAAQEKSEA